MSGSTQDRKALTLGSGELHFNGAWAGTVNGLQLERTVEIKTHETNTNIEFKVDHVIPLSTAMMLSGNFGEISPQVMNLLFSGGAGFSSPQAVYNVGGRGTYAPSGGGVITNSEYAFLADNLDDAPQWVPMMYQPAPADAGAHTPPFDLSAVNTTNGAGPPTGYFAFVTTVTIVGPPVLESIPSNIAIVPYWALTDTVKLDWSASTFATPANACYIYRAPCTVSNGVPYISGPWVAYQNAGSTGGWTAVGALTLTTTLEATNWDGAGYDSTVVVTAVDDLATIYTEGTDYIVDYYSRKIMRAPGSALIDAFDRVFVSYSYLTDNMAEIPLTASGRIPEMEVDIFHTFPDNESRFHIKLWRAVMNTAARYALNERDWQNQPFSIQILNAEESKPTYQFGYIRIMGPIASRISALGNVPFYDFGVLGRTRPAGVTDAG